MEKGRCLIEELIAFATRPEFVYPHRWRKGDLIVWDNRCTMHRACAYDDSTVRRDLRRTTVSDEINTVERAAAGGVVGGDQECRRCGSHRTADETRPHRCRHVSCSSNVPRCQLDMPTVWVPAPWRDKLTGGAAQVEVAGDTVRQVIEALEAEHPGFRERIIAADQDRLWGRAYIDLRGISSGQLKAGEDRLRQVAEITRRRGFTTVVDETPGMLPVGYPAGSEAPR